MKKILLILFVLLLITSLPSLCSDNVLSGSIKIDKIINNAPELIRYTAMGDKDNVRFLLQKGADPNQTFMMLAPSFVAVYKNYPEILEILLDYGADPNDSYMGETLLGFAIYRNNFKCVKILVDNGADVNLKFLNNYPIYIALKNNYTDISRLLYNKGAYIDKKCNKIIKKRSIIF